MQARYVHDGPPAVTLFTVIATENGQGAHSGLMINGSERLMFDPAGSWSLPRLAERNDVHFGMTDKMVGEFLEYRPYEDMAEFDREIGKYVDAAEVARFRTYVTL